MAPGCHVPLSCVRAGCPPSPPQAGGPGQGRAREGPDTVLGDGDPAGRVGSGLPAHRPGCLPPGAGRPLPGSWLGSSGFWPLILVTCWGFLLTRGLLSSSGLSQLSAPRIGVSAWLASLFSRAGAASPGAIPVRSPRWGGGGQRPSEDSAPVSFSAGTRAAVGVSGWDWGRRSRRRKRLLPACLEEQGFRGTPA